MTRQHRLNPSKLLVLFLYGDYPYMSVEHKSDDVKKVTIRIGGFAKLMRVRNSHILEYLEWLEQMGFITITGVTKKTATLVLSPPTLFRAEL